MFYSYDIIEEDKVSLVIGSFTYLLLDWWNYIREYRWRNGSTPISSWESLKEVLIDNFGIIDYREQETINGDPCTFLKHEDSKVEKGSKYVNMEDKYEKEPIGEAIMKC